MALTKVTAAVIEPTAVTDNISNGSIDSDKIADDAVTSAKIADNSIDSEHYVDESIDTEHFSLTAAINTVTNQNSGTLKLWNGSQAEYDALTPDANTVYFII